MSEHEKHRHHFDMDGAYEAGEKRHPQLVIREHYPDASNFEPVTVADCWLFDASPRDGTPSYFRDITARPWGWP